MMAGKRSLALVGAGGVSPQEGVAEPAGDRGSPALQQVGPGDKEERKMEFLEDLDGGP